MTRTELLNDYLNRGKAAGKAESAARIAELEQMDEQRIADITAALRDLLGPTVVHLGLASGWRWKTFYEAIPDVMICWDIDPQGEVASDQGYNGHDLIGPWTLDKLHAASQIVRRMNHA